MRRGVDPPNDADMPGPSATTQSAWLSPSPRSQSPPVTIEPPQGAIGFDLKPLWRYRELLSFFAWRDLKVRYKQTLLGAAGRCSSRSCT